MLLEGPACLWTHIMIAENIVPGEVGYCGSFDRILVKVDPVRIQAACGIPRIHPASTST